MITVRPKLEAMTSAELVAESVRINGMLDDDESYLHDHAGLTWCYDRLNKIDELLNQRDPPLTFAELSELLSQLDAYGRKKGWIE